MIGNSNDKTNFPYKLLLTDTQFWKIHKAFANGSSANRKLSKTQMSKTIQSEGILGEFLVALPYTVLKAGTQELIKTSPELAKDPTRYFVKHILLFRYMFYIYIYIYIFVRNSTLSEVQE